MLRSAGLVLCLFVSVLCIAEREKPNFGSHLNAERGTNLPGNDRLKSQNHPYQHQPQDGQDGFRAVDHDRNNQNQFQEDNLRKPQHPDTTQSQITQFNNQPIQEDNLRKPQHPDTTQSQTTQFNNQPIQEDNLRKPQHPDTTQSQITQFNNQPIQEAHNVLNKEENKFEDKGKTNKTHNTGNGEKGEEEEEKEVCFPHLGCFEMGKPWKTLLRPIPAPFSPEKIQTTLFFYSRLNPDKQRNITLYPQIHMGEAQFDPNKITAIIAHGFANSGNATWMKDMKDAYLKQVDANVMIVDWGKGAQLLNYLQVSGNIRVVGKQLGKFVNYLIQNYRANPSKFHLIGHSLGAHICSYLAKDVPGIARLTALDPAQPAFEGFDKEVRLDKDDAEFVDVIHTDARPFIPALGFGMITPQGDVDFYMNGGFDQPGCIRLPDGEIPAVKNILDLAKFPVEYIAKAVACPHGRAYEFFTESLNETNKCIFWGHKAKLTNIFKSVTNTLSQGLLKKFVALSSTCSKEDCVPLGLVTAKSPLRGQFVVTTSETSPYCISEPGVSPEAKTPKQFFKPIVG